MNNHFYKWFSRSMRQGMASPTFMKVALMAITMLVSVGVYAQDKTITGKVTDGSDNSGLPGVSVSVSGTNTGTQTDVSGNYKITVPTNATLIYSFIGFAKQSIEVGNRSVINVTLISENKALEEVVVVGYGTQKVKDATGSVSSLNPKDFTQGLIASPEQLLQGRIAGVNVTPSSGDPGSAATFNIRGAGSIRAGNGPLFVVDGVPLDNGDGGNSQDNGAGQTAPRNPLTFLNPNDIENISVLKDASSAAIYGSRGANGVVLITTKKGKSGQGFNFSSDISVSTTASRYDLLNAADYLKGIVKFGGSLDAIKGQTSATTDWQNEVYRTAVSQNYNLGYGGGNNDTRYRVNLGFSDQQGIIKKSALNRLNARLNFSQDLFNDKLVLDFTGTVSGVTNTFAPVTNNAGATGSLIGNMISANPAAPIFNADGSYNQTLNVRNPAAYLAYYDDKENLTRYLLNFSATYKITPELSTKTNLGLDITNADRNQFIDAKLSGFTGTTGVRGYNIQQAGGQAWNYKRDNTSKLWEQTVTYDKKMGSNALNVLVGYSYQKFESNSNARFGTEATGTDVKNANGTFKNKGAFGDTLNNELQSYFARANYSIMDRYFFTGTVRADGSTRFGANNKYGVFPAFAFKWKLMNENFIPKSVFSDLSLRINWGKTGNQEFDNYVSKSISQWNYNGVGYVPINAANPDIKWETTTTYGAGIDFALLKGKVSGTVDYFNRATSDLLFLNQPAQPTSATQKWVNLPGIVRNTGVEVGLNIQAVQGKDFSWEILANATSISNVLENFGSTIVFTGEINGPGLSGSRSQQFTTGTGLYEFYLPTYTGLSSTGYSQLANDGSYGYVGSPIPKLTFGLTNNFTYKNLSASMFWTGSTGFSVYNNTANAHFLSSLLLNARNVTYDVLNSNEANNNAGAVSTRFLEKGDFYRLANMNVSYLFKLSASSKIKSLTLSLSGQNLALITSYTGLDPEINVSKPLNGVPSRGIDYTAYPKARTFTLGLSANF